MTTTDERAADLDTVDCRRAAPLRQPLPPPADVLLADGTIARVRVATPDDTEALAALHAGMSGGQPADAVLLAQPARRRGVRRAPARATPARSRCWSSARAGWSRWPPPSRSSPRWPRSPSSSTTPCTAWASAACCSSTSPRPARALGMRRFVAEVLGENRAMIDVFLDAGFAVRRRAESGTVHVEMDTVASAEAVEAADERECRAETRSLQPLLYPRSVAVAGVRRDGSGVGAAVLRSIVAGGYRGDLWAVHPQADGDRRRPGDAAAARPARAGRPGGRRGAGPAGGRHAARRRGRRGAGGGGDQLGLRGARRGGGPAAARRWSTWPAAAASGWSAPTAWA